VVFAFVDGYPILIKPQGLYANLIFEGVDVCSRPDQSNKIVTFGYFLACRL